jgi:hypothetical protein
MSRKRNKALTWKKFVRESMSIMQETEKLLFRIGLFLLFLYGLSRAL